MFEDSESDHSLRARVPSKEGLNMADSMLGDRFDFILKDQTRLEGTLEAVNQVTRQLTISAGALPNEPKRRPALLLDIFAHRARAIAV